MSFIKEFKEFAMKGNVVDLATGVVIGAAFGKIVTSLVNDILMPVITIATGKIDFANLFISLDGSHYATIELAKESGAATLNYGMFLTNVLDFFDHRLCYFHYGQADKQAEKKAISCPGDY